MTTDLHHPLIAEFPEHRDAIHQLKMSDAHFRRFFDEYHEVDREVVRMEEGIEPVTDAVAEALKLKRLRLKDELHRQLKAFKG